MHRRTYAIGAAALAATSALGAGVIDGASANRGGSPGTAAAPPGAPPGGGPPGYFTHRVGPGGPGRRASDADLFAVMRDVHAAIAAKAPDLAKPIIDKAVSDGDISSAQGDRLTKVVDDKRLTALTLKRCSPTRRSRRSSSRSRRPSRARRPAWPSRSSTRRSTTRRSRAPRAIA